MFSRTEKLWFAALVTILLVFFIALYVANEKAKEECRSNGGQVIDTSYYQGDTYIPRHACILPK